MASLLVTNGTVVTLGDEPRVLPDHEVACEDGRVRAVRPAGSVLEEFFDRVVDARGGLVVPGFVNAHMHFYSTLVRGLGKAEPSADFQQVLEHLWWRLDRTLTVHDSYLSAMVAGIEAIRHGTTTIIDHHASPGAVEGSLDALAAAVDELGLRASLCYEVSDRDGADVARAGIAENVRFAERCAAAGGDRLRAMMGLHASFTVSDATLERAASAARSLGIGCHVHVAEAASDQERTRAEHGVGVVERFRRAGVLGPRTVAAHAVHVDADEIATLAESETAVVTNAQSNLNNAVGIADLPALDRAGVLVGLGTDAMTTHMLQEARVALWAQHHRAGDPSVGFSEVVGALVHGNRRIAARQWDLPLGVIDVGAAADLAVLDYHPPTALDAATLPGHLLFGVVHAPVRTTVVAGEVLMENGVLTRVDEAEVAAQAREAAERLWERF